MDQGASARITASTRAPAFTRREEHADFGLWEVPPLLVRAVIPVKAVIPGAVTRALAPLPSTPLRTNRDSISNTWSTRSRIGGYHR
jgi:hypothetical protein